MPYQDWGISGLMFDGHQASSLKKYFIDWSQAGIG
jgi:hypothetical protein